MAGAEALIGGMLNGFVGSKQQAQQNAAMNEYRKVMTDHIKTQAKLDEQKLNLMMMKSQGLPPQLINDLNMLEARGQAQQQGQSQAPGTPQINQPNVPPIAQVPQQPGFAQMMAGQQLSGLMGGPARQIPPMPLASGVNPSAAANLARMEQEFGEPIKVTDSFRTSAQQADVYARKPNLAAPPGHSLHERGLAFDIDPDQANRLAQAGLLDKYGFQRPMLGQGASGKNEPWHIEFAGAGGQGQIPQQPSTPPPPMFPRKTGIQALPLGSRVALDVWFHENYGGFDPKFREDKNDFDLKGNPYDGYTVFNKRKGNIEYAIPPVQGKMEPYNYQLTPGGPTFYGYRPKEPIMPLRGGSPGGGGMGASGIPGGMVSPQQYGLQEIPDPNNPGRKLKVAMPAPAPGQGFTSELAPQEVSKEMPSTAKEKLVGMNTFIKQLEGMAEVGKDENLFGTIQEMRYRLGRTAVGGLPLVRDMIRSDPKLAAFMQLADTVHATRLFELGGKQATAMELKTVMNTLATTKDYKTFQTQSKIAIKLANQLRDEIKAGYSSSEKELLSPTKPSLDLKADPLGLR